MSKTLRKTAGSSESGEEISQLRAKVLTRADTRAATHALFTNAAAAQKRDRDVVDKLFIQAPGAETMSPQLVKEKISAAKHVEEYFAKLAAEPQLTTAQRLFPELLKVANEHRPRPAASIKDPKPGAPSGPTAVRSPISGGSA